MHAKFARVIPMTRTSLRSPALPIAIRNRQDFNANNTLTATNGRFHGAGRLPRCHIDKFFTASDTPDFYAIYSYATPIAWYSDGTWTIPDVTYSVTTSRHQGIVRRAVNA